MNEKEIVREMNRCVHFTGIMAKTCDAGVEYHSVRDDSAKPYRWPCFGRTMGCATTCGKAEYPTREQATAALAESDAAVERAILAMTAASKHAGGKRGISGSIPCPCCEGGEIHYSISSYNGHLHGACTTPGCAQWIQ